MKKWIKAITVDSIVFSFIIFGGIYKIEWVYNIAIFILWFFIITSFLSLFADNDELKWKKRSKYFNVYHYSTDILSIFLLVAIGWFWTATFKAISKFMLEVKYQEVVKDNNE